MKTTITHSFKTNLRTNFTFVPEFTQHQLQPRAERANDEAIFRQERTQALRPRSAGYVIMQVDGALRFVPYCSELLLENRAPKKNKKNKKKEKKLAARQCACVPEKNSASARVPDLTPAPAPASELEESGVSVSASDPEDSSAPAATSAVTAGAADTDTDAVADAAATDDFDHVFAEGSPLAKLYPYQRAWVRDTSRFKIGLMARQVGKSLTCAAEAVWDCIRRPGATWLILSAGERQALEFMQKVKDWCHAFQEATGLFKGKNNEPGSATIRRNEVRWSNGSRIFALPANPQTVRGYSANLILDEFAFHEHPEEIWRAIYPSITNQVKEQFKLRIISTPNGKNNLFYDLWTRSNLNGVNNPMITPDLITPEGKLLPAPDILPVTADILPAAADHLPPAEQAADCVEAQAATAATNSAAFETSATSTTPAAPKGGIYKRYKITIQEAVAQGLVVDMEELKAGIFDHEAWAQEFECEFLDQASVLMPYELIQSCESAEASEEAIRLAALNSYRPSQIFLGLDIGRKKDLTVLWMLEKMGDLLWTRGLLVLEKLPFADQLSQILPIARHATCMCVDATGIGAMLAEELIRFIGSHRIHPCVFTAPFKEEIFLRMRHAFEDRRVRIPASRVVREELHSLQRVSTATGHIRFIATRTEEGHCDRATALALALHAARYEAPAMQFKPLKQRNLLQQASQLRKDRTLF